MNQEHRLRPALSRAREENGKMRQTACKPGSVPPVPWFPMNSRIDGHSSGTFVTERLSRPTRAATRKRVSSLRRGSMPPLFGLAPGGVYRAASVAGRAVRSYRTLSPLPAAPKRNRRFAFCGTFPRVAPAGRYPAPCFRGARTFLPTGNPQGDRPTV